jgi:WhiB family redox-sensing transcriptional regulator
MNYDWEDEKVPTKKYVDPVKPWIDLSWQTEGNCYDGVDPEIFHYTDGEKGQARREREAKALSVCAGCPVQLQCLKQALHFNDRTSIIGGTTPAMRGSVVYNQPLWPLEQILESLANGSPKVEKKPVVKPAVAPTISTNQRLEELYRHDALLIQSIKKAMREKVQS